MIKTTILLATMSLGLVSAWPDLYFYSQHSPNSAVKVNNGINGVTGFNKDRETKFLIHGFSDSYRGTRVAKVRAALVENTNANIIVVDWEKGAAMPWYWDAVDNTRIVGKFVGEFIKANLDPAKVHCIGHSLGAHTCGFVGQTVHLARISGLDPAGPWFYSNGVDERLDKTDADFVDIIHTDSMCGIQKPIGHKDYFPNGGATMAGCGVTSITNLFGVGKKRSAETMTLEEAIWSVQHEEDDNKVVFKVAMFHKGDPRNRFIDLAEVFACSHLRVMHYYAESLTSSCGFSSTPCSDYSAWKKGSCSCGSSGCSNMGINAHLNKQTGLFYLDTNRYSPFCKQ